jgi:hypothetical protein
MAQEDYTIANADGATVRADINSHLSAIVSNNSGATCPGDDVRVSVSGADTSTGLLKIRNSANSAWGYNRHDGGCISRLGRSRYRADVHKIAAWHDHCR